MTRTLSSRTSIIGATGAALALAFSGSAVMAQDSSDPAHPVHIHSGTCEQLGDVVFPLSYLSDEMLIGEESAAGDQVGASNEDGLRVSVTTVDATVSDIAGAEHAINAHMSDEDMGTYIACGNVGGTLIDDSLAFRLKEQSSSGHQGLAWLEDTGEGTTNVTLFLWQDTDAMTGEPTTDAEASPDATMDAEASPDATMDAEASPDAAMDAEASPDAAVEGDVEAQVEGEIQVEGTIEVDETIEIDETIDESDEEETEG